MWKGGLSKNEAKKEALEDRLGRVLGRSWADLGVLLGSKMLKFYWFCYYFVENGVFEKKSSRDPSWAYLGSKVR